LIEAARGEDIPDQPECGRLSKRWVLGAVGKLGRDDQAGTVVAALRTILREPAKGRRHGLLLGAVDALGYLGPIAKDAVPDLIRLIGDPDPEIRRSAIDALGLLGPPAAPATPMILAALKDPDHPVRKLAVISLGRIARPDPRIPEIVAALESLARDDPEIRGVAGL